MEEQVLQLLQATTRPDTVVIRNAEQGLLRLYPQAEFPFALLTIAIHNDIESSSRKAALTALKNYIVATWSPQFDETFTGNVYLNDEAKARVRDQVFGICTAEGDQAPRDPTIQALAAGVASKIATVDFPDAWPSLFPSLLTILTTSTNDAPIHGALRVLAELVDSGLTEEQFFLVAPDLVRALQHVAVDSNRSLIVRAMTLNVFRACFEMLEMVMGDHGAAVRAFLDESMKAWMPFFMETLKQPLIQTSKPTVDQNDIQFRGLVALKVQVVKTLDKLRQVYVHAISPHAVVLFQIVWEELSRIADPYAELFIDGSAEGKLVDSDNLPCSLDALVLEEIDFLQITIKAPPVRAELSGQMKQLGDAQHTVPWLQELIRVLALYARIPQEEEALWEYDANLYLCEATSLTANYTPRAACAELAVRSLGEWLKQVPIKAMLHFNQQTLNAYAPAAGWKEREALLYLLNQCLGDVDDISGELNSSTASAVLEQVSGVLQDSQCFLRAAAQLVLGSLFKVAGQDFFSAGAAAFSNAINASTTDSSDVVKIACLSIIPDYIRALPKDLTRSLQGAIFNAVGEFMASHDLRDELEDADDVKAALIETLRDAIMLDTSSITDGDAIDLFFTLASNGASNFQLFTLLTEAFEGIVSSIVTHGPDHYVRLCAKTIPSLTGAFDVANMTQESALTNLAAELVNALAECGSEPLPDGFVSAVMPKLQRVLLEATEAELVRPATLAVEHMLSKGTSQFLAWTDSQGKSSVEVILTVVNRLLNSPDVDENAAQEVGGLASTLVSKLGADKLGPYLMDLLQAVAVRLATADRIQFIQSLCMVFVGLSLAAPNDVVAFLSEVNINGTNGLAVVLTQWLENSVHFAGFDQVRQNIVALSKIFSLHDPRVKAVNVKGDLIVDANPSGRIKTRSQAKLNPDRWTSVSADLKILKILVDELASAATSRYPNFAAAKAAADALEAAAAEADEADDADDADEWEDMGTAGAIDLASAAIRGDLMSLAGEIDGKFDGDGEVDIIISGRVRDEETADYLLQWFKGEAEKQEFAGLFEQLTDEEKAKLQQLVV